jgi:replicative DNA helicase
MNRMQNPEYEQILLGSILIDPRILDENRITGDLFVEPACLAVFRCIDEARAAKAPVNIREIGLRSGNPAFVAGLSDQTCSAANAEFYLKALGELAQKRALMRVLRGTIEGLLEGRQWDEVFGGLSREITSLSLTGLRDPYSHISREMPNFIARLEEKYLLKGALSGLPSGFPGLNSMTNGF